jgi:hypothetical protein
MSTQVQATDTQQALFGQWAQGTKFQLDLDDSPKRQFNILAKLLGWIGGEEPWNANWLACFEEDYIWRAFGIYSCHRHMETTDHDRSAHRHLSCCAWRQQ